MTDLTVCDVMARAFAAEGVDTVFTLMGDANMVWSLAMKDQGARLVHARHEHAGVAMADGYARATGKVGVASVTCGPGFTQIMTALTVSARARTPLIVMAGDTPMSSSFHIQQIDQGPLATATGAAYLPVRTAGRMLDQLREAFYIARHGRMPVVLSVPQDLQTELFPYPDSYRLSGEAIPAAQRSLPDPAIVRQVAELLQSAEKPIILAGRGAVRAKAGPAIAELAERSGALLATTLPARELFYKDPFAIGIAGAFATPLARECFAESDLMLAVGAGLGFYTTEAGYLFPNARVVAIDIEPKGIWQGQQVAEIALQADARAATRALLAELPPATRATFRTADLAQRIAAQTGDVKPFPLAPLELDPRAVVREIDRVLPEDWDIVYGGGHCFNFAVAGLAGRSPEQYHAITEFGTIGQSIGAAIGVAAARGNGKVALFQGDGSLLMHIQELETAARHGIKLLICALNDGAYGSEVHLLRAKGYDPSEVVFGRPDLAGIANACGVMGTRVNESGGFARLFDSYARSERPALWDIHVACIAAAPYRRIHFGEID